MAHRKAGGTAKNLNDSKPKYLGVKLYHGQEAGAGAIIVRQRGTKIVSGRNTDLGKDHTIFATKAGRVEFDEVRKRRYDGTIKRFKRANVVNQ